MRLQGGKARQDRAHHAAIHDAARHRAGLVHRHDHVPLPPPVLPGEKVEPIGYDRAAILLVILEVFRDRTPPVEVRQARDRLVARAVERAAHRAFELALHSFFDLLHDGPDDLARGVLGPVRDHVLHREQRAHELDARRDLRERLGLEEQLLPALFLDRVLLNDRDDVLLEILPHVSEPRRELRAARAEPGAALAAAAAAIARLALLDVVKRAERRVHFSHLAREQSPSPPPPIPAPPPPHI